MRVYSRSLDSNSAILIARPIRRGGMSISIFAVTCDKHSRNGKRFKPRKVNLYGVKEMLTLPFWFVDLCVSVDECGGPDTFRMRPPESLANRLLNVLRLRSTMALVVPISSTTAHPLYLKTTTPRFQVNGSQDTRDCSARLLRTCFIHPYNDLNKWESVSTLLIFTKYLSILNLKPWAPETFYLLKCVNMVDWRPLITPILFIKK